VLSPSRAYIRTTAVCYSYTDSEKASPNPDDMREESGDEILRAGSTYIVQYLVRVSYLVEHTDGAPENYVPGSGRAGPRSPPRSSHLLLAP
jgi:hypothetical protein